LLELLLLVEVQWGRERELEGVDVHPTLIEMRES
jgi:hypothetical protein